MDKKGSVFGSASFKKVQKGIESIKQKTLFLQRFRKFQESLESIYGAGGSF
nr:MAG TPA: hypothetical protein [Caudoviricetes sp.]